MPYNRRPCATPGCANLADTGPRCPTCTARTPRSREHGGYVGRGHRLFRAGVLTRDPVCVCPGCRHCTDHPCQAAASRADHFPHSRQQLIAQHMNPDDPRFGRGLCASCDSYQTARRQPGVS